MSPGSFFLTSKALLRFGRFDNSLLPGLPFFVNLRDSFKASPAFASGGRAKNF